MARPTGRGTDSDLSRRKSLISRMRLTGGQNEGRLAEEDKRGGAREDLRSQSVTNMRALTTFSWRGVVVWSGRLVSKSASSASSEALRASRVRTEKTRRTTSCKRGEACGENRSQNSGKRSSDWNGSSSEYCEAVSGCGQESRRGRGTYGDVNEPAREVFRGLLAARLEFLGRVQAEELLQLVGRVRSADAQVFVVGLELNFGGVGRGVVGAGVHGVGGLGRRRRGHGGEAGVRDGLRRRRRGMSWARGGRRNEKRG